MEDLTVEQNRVLDHIDQTFGGHEVVGVLDDWGSAIPAGRWAIEVSPMWNGDRFPSWTIARDGSTNRDEALVLAALRMSDLHAAGIARITTLPLPTVLRALADLVERGLVEHHEDVVPGRFGIIEHERRN